MRKFCFWCLAVFLAASVAHAEGKAKHVIVIVWDGMRPDFISQEHTPALYQLAHDGVMFTNHHPVYCSSTEVNGTAIATGAYPSHSGVIANHEYRREIGTLRPIDIESAAIVRQGDAATHGHYLLRPTVAEILQATGLKTAIAGSKPIALLHDRRERKSDANVTLYSGETLPPIAVNFIADKLGPFPPLAEDKEHLPNASSDQWTTRALIDSLWSANVPAYSLLWLSEPDYSQHATGPGSPTALSALESCDFQLSSVIAALERKKLRDQTDIFVVSDHGFSTIGDSINVQSILTNGGFHAYRQFKSTPQKGDVLVVSQGGTDLFYVIGHDAAVIRKLVAFLQKQECAGVIFTAQPMDGTFTLDQANLDCPNPPDVLMSLHWSSGKSTNGTPGLIFSDGGRKTGEGNHASLSHFDMHNTLVAAGPDFKTSFTDTMPSGNTDLAPTVLWLLGVKSPVAMDGRVLSEALTATNAPSMSEPTTKRIEAKLSDGSWSQYLQISKVNDTVYFDEGNGSVNGK